MAAHSGKNGVVTLKKGAPAKEEVVKLTGFSITETVGTVDTTGAGDTWETHDTTQKAWSGSIDMNADHGGLGQGFRAGDVLVFEGYTDGDATGKTFFSGDITLTDHGVTHTHNGTVTRSYSFKGNGALTVAVVS